VVAVEQLGAEERFELRDMTADRPLRHIQVLCRQGKVHHPGGHFEGAEGVERRQSKAHRAAMHPQENSSIG
jgi:hypothetical protein